MKRIAKSLVGAVVLGLATIGVAACGGNSATKAKVSLAGETANGQGEYTLSLEAGNPKRAKKRKT